MVTNNKKNVLLNFSRLGQVGRLGNQLFQVAFITQFAKRHSLKYGLPYWRYADYFDYNFNFADNVSDYNYDIILREPGLGYHESYFIKYVHQMQTLNANIITGYFQSYKYFEKTDILKIFKSNDKYNCPAIPQKSVAISVRRGDFVKHKDYLNIEASTFKELLKNFKGYHVFVFTDDYKYCKNEFSGNNFEFMEGLTDIEQILTMCSFENFILSNSTFSYWGPMLSKNPKTVFYPKFMFPDMNRCELYNRIYWPQNTSIYFPYLNPINKPFL